MGCPHVTPAENHRKSLSRDEYEKSARYHEYLSSLDDSDIIHKAKQLNEEQSFERKFLFIYFFLHILLCERHFSTF